MGNVALLFSGQGAQTVGMGKDLAEQFEAARHTFDEANEALGLDLAALCFSGPEEELCRTDICQPAVLTHSVAVLRAMKEFAPESAHPRAAAGLSLGEYSALVAAGSLSFGDAVTLVHRRGRYMQDACKETRGSMCSILGLEDARIEEACAAVRAGGGAVWPANYNSPGQVVISGEESAVQCAAQRCREMGARKAVTLRVAGAFHTELMASAAARLQAELDVVEWHEPAFPVVTNVTGQPLRNAAEAPSVLARQVTSPVRWAECVRWMRANGAELFYEIGPGRVLQGLLRRIAPEARCTSLGTSEDIRGLQERL